MTAPEWKTLEKQFHRVPMEVNGDHRKPWKSVKRICDISKPVEKKKNINCLHGSSKKCQSIRYFIMQGKPGRKALRKQCIVAAVAATAEGATSN